MKILRIKSDQDRLEIGDIVADYRYKGGNPQRISGFMFPLDEPHIIIHLKEDVNKAAKHFDAEKLAAFTDQENLRIVRDSAKLARIPKWVRWIFNAYDK